MDRIAPAEILGRRMIKKGNAAEVELLIRWTNLPESEATWEEYQRLKLQFPGQGNFDGEGNVRN